METHMRIPMRYVGELRLLKGSKDLGFLHLLGFVRPCDAFDAPFGSIEL
jgi:hypothetical protein